MARPRTHTFSIVTLGVAMLALGFGMGLFVTGFLRAKRKSHPDVGAGSTVMSKRMTAIKKAIKEGRSDYEFEIGGFQPVLK
jgi:hypothetical protein